MPGEMLEDALAECQRLAAVNTGSVITRLGENITSLDEAAEVARHYATALADIQRRALSTQLSVKLTQLGLDQSAEEVVRQTRQIAQQDTRPQSPIWIDMESSAYTERTLNVFRALRAETLNVGVCVQAYLLRTESDLQQLLEHSTAIRLVKGAYKEPATVAYQRKRDVDRNYLRCADMLLHATHKNISGHVPVFATHDVAIMAAIKARAQALGIPRTHYEFQMLYGINTAEQLKLVQEGYRLRVLISYGSAWFAWYMRRLAERPANVWFVMRSMMSA
jgi:proline dehydrogenase